MSPLPFIAPTQGHLGFIAAGLLIAFVGGWQVRGWVASADQLHVSEQNRRAEGQAQQRTDQLAGRLENERSKQATRDRIITQDIASYDQITPATHRCNLPATWRLRHDAAATGTPADPASLPVGDAGEVTDITALETLAINYQTCREWRRQLTGWQAWWQMQRTDMSSAAD